MAPNRAQILHLFSSDFRPLYIQDCLDLLAKPAGSLQRFRYQQKWVSVPPLQPEQRVTERLKISTWETLSESTRVIVYFAWVANLPTNQDTVYVPLRSGKIVRTGVEEGHYFFVDFTLGDYIDPVRFQPATPDGTPTFQEETAAFREGHRLPLLEKLTTSVRADLGNRCPAGTYGGESIKDGFSAVLGDPPRGLGNDPGKKSTTPAAFKHAAESLGELLSRPDGNSTNYADAFIKTLRVRRLRQGGDPALTSGAKFGGASLDLRSGNLYEIDVLVIRTTERPDPITLSVSPPQACAMVSHDEFILTSRYDKATFRFFTEARDNPTVGEMTVRTALVKKDPGQQPPGGSGGAKQANALLPVARLQVRVKPRRFLSLSAYMAAALTAVATFCVAIIGQKGVYLGTQAIKDAGDNTISVSNLFSWLGGGDVSLSITGLAVATLTGFSAGGAALLVLVRKRYGLST